MNPSRISYKMARMAALFAILAWASGGASKTATEISPEVSAGTDSYEEFRKTAPSAKLARRRQLVSAAIVFAILTAWSIRHVYGGIEIAKGGATQFAVIYAVSFVMLVWIMVLCHLDHPVKDGGVDNHYVVVNVPVYNEDPELLRHCLASLLRQSRPPDEIHVVDDGSAVDYSDAEEEFLKNARLARVESFWTRTVNGGKRQAQGKTVIASPKATIYTMIDSDSVLDGEAIREGLKPFVDDRVQSVGGVVLALNSRHNLLTRLTDLWFVTGQLVDRSSYSAMGAVLVNSGALAFYRADMVRRYLDGYLNETFFGRRVELSDDSMLTIYALEHGRAVHQSSSFAFSVMPENLSHHIRQQLRWQRGAFIRSWWRFKYLSPRRYAYWGHFLGWVTLAMSSVVFATLFIAQPTTHLSFDPVLLLIPLLIGYGLGLRYLAVRRSDESFGSQLFTYFLAPIATLWSFFFLRGLRFYAMATCLKTGWGTRQQVEVIKND